MLGIVLPSSLAAIDSSAFSGVPGSMEVYAPLDSYAYAWAGSNSRTSVAYTPLDPSDFTCDYSN